MLPNLSMLIPPLFQFGYKVKLNKQDPGNSLAVQWLVLCTFTAKSPGSIPGWGTKILQASRGSQKKKQGLDLGIISSTFSSNPKVNSNYKSMKE